MVCGGVEISWKIDFIRAIDWPQWLHSIRLRCLQDPQKIGCNRQCQITFPWVIPFTCWAFKLIPIVLNWIFDICSTTLDCPSLQAIFFHSFYVRLIDRVGKIQKCISFEMHNGQRMYKLIWATTILHFQEHYTSCILHEGCGLMGICLPTVCLLNSGRVRIHLASHQPECLAKENRYFQEVKLYYCIIHV